MRGGSRKCTFSRYCKWQIALKRILMLTEHILLPNYTISKTFWQFENLVFVIMSTRENIRLIARTPLVRYAVVSTSEKKIFQSVQKFISDSKRFKLV